MTTEELQTITRQLAPIEMPPPPDWQPLIITVIIFALTTVIAVVVYWLHQRKNTIHKENINTAAVAELKRLRQLWQQGEMDDRLTAYHLCTVLRIGLQLKQLTDTPPATLNAELSQWQQTLKQLKALRYQRQTHAKLDDETFSLIHKWLNRGVATC